MRLAYGLLSEYVGPPTQVSQQDLARRERCQEQQARWERYLRDIELFPKRLDAEKRVFAAVQKAGKQGIVAVFAELTDVSPRAVVEVLASWSYLNIPDLLGIDPADLVKEYQASERAAIEAEIRRRRDASLIQDAATMLIIMQRRRAMAGQ